MRARERNVGGVNLRLRGEGVARGGKNNKKGEQAKHRADLLHVRAKCAWIVQFADSYSSSRRFSSRHKEALWKSHGVRVETGMSKQFPNRLEPEIDHGDGAILRSWQFAMGIDAQAPIEGGGDFAGGDGA